MIIIIIIVAFIVARLFTVTVSVWVNDRGSHQRLA